jgi:hypothetical protein
MWKWIALLAFSPAAVLAMPMARIKPTQSTALEARAALERQLGQSIDQESFAHLEKLIEQEGRRDTIPVGNQAPSKAIYCVGGNASLGWVMGQAACVHIWTMKTYQLGFIGAGMSANLVGQVFRLKISFDPSRYDDQFDPIPGKYSFAQRGFTLGAGATWFAGDSGNKVLTGFGFNFLLGFDMLSVSYLVIE